MKAWFIGLFARPEPALSAAAPRDAATLAALHAASFNRGWSEHEFEQLLTHRNVIADRATSGRTNIGFILSRRAADEAEILSVAVARAWRRHSGLHYAAKSDLPCWDLWCERGVWQYRDDRQRESG